MGCLWLLATFSWLPIYHLAARWLLGSSVSHEEHFTELHRCFVDRYHFSPHDPPLFRCELLWQKHEELLRELAALPLPSPGRRKRQGNPLTTQRFALSVCAKLMACKRRWHQRKGLRSEPGQETRPKGNGLDCLGQCHHG